MGMAKKRRNPKPKPEIEYPPVPTKKWIPPDQRKKQPRPAPPYTKPEGISQKLKISSLKKVWNQFEVIGNSAILLGHYSQTHKKYTFKTNGYQGACNCAVACIFAYMYKTSSYTRYSVDKILDMGDHLYAKSILQPDNLCVTEIPPERVYNSLFIEDQRIAFVLEVKKKTTDRLATISEQNVKEVFSKALESFFKSYAVGVFSIKGKHLAIWIQDNAYYLFDPIEHQDNGELWTSVPGLGFSIIYRCKKLENLVDNIYKNVDASIQDTKFDIVGCVVQRVIKINIVPPETFEDITEPQPKPPHEPIEDAEELKPVDIQKERLHVYVSEKRPSLASKITESSPEIGDSPPAEQRPSWMGEGGLQRYDSCRYPIPPIVLPDKISYYTELVPRTVGILRGTTCQTDPSLSKYQGRQCMGNAISALIMLRIYKAQDWVPRTVNTVLKNGDMLYRDAMISIPRTQSLKLSNFQKKTEYEGKFFMPIVEDFSVIGRLESREEGVVDLLPALEDFLLEHDGCVVSGPLTLAVWSEGTKFFMFDPNERDAKGKAIRNDIAPIEYIPGVACVVWFTKLKDLVDLYMYNVDKSKKSDTFYLNKVHIDDYIEIPDIWSNFKGLQPAEWILRGTISQSDKQFERKSRNLQCAAISLVALAVQSLKPLKDWTQETVDQIVIQGDRLYNDTVDYLTENGKFVNKMLKIEEILKKLRIDKQEAHFSVEKCYVGGFYNRKGPVMGNALQNYFIDNDMAVVTARSMAFALWKKDNYYYLFDSHDRNEKGLAKGFGTACVLRAQLIEDLTSTLETNLRPSKDDSFCINRIKIQFYEIGIGDYIQPPLNYYTSLGPGTAILRSIYSEISNKFEINSGKQTIPMCLMALTFNKLKPALNWSKADVDEILNKGNALFDEIMDEMKKKDEGELVEKSEEEPGEKLEADNEGDEDEKAGGAVSQPAPPVSDASDLESEDEETEFRITSDNVKDECTIGVNKFKLEFEEVGQGNIKEDLRNALKTAYSNPLQDEHDHQELLLEAKSLNVSIWRDEDLFFVFDSKPRDKKGLAVNIIQWMNPDGTQPDLHALHMKRKAAERAERLRVKVEHGHDGESEEGQSEREDDTDYFAEGEPTLQQYYSYLMRGRGGDEEEYMSESEDDLERYFPLIVKSSSFWKEKEKAGKACTLWFTNLDSMVDYVYNNIPGWERKEDFTLKSVKISNTVSLADKLRSSKDRIDVYGGDWYFFKEIKHGKWILRGTMTLLSELFPEKNRGKQNIPCCCTALAIAFVFKMICFNDTTVDSILSYGDKLHTYIKRLRKKQLMDTNRNLSEDEVDWLLQHEEVEIADIPNKICISKFLVTVMFERDKIVGDVKAQKVENVMDVKRGVDKFFENDYFGILEAKGHTVAIWRGQKMFYMFDGFSRGPNGIKSPFGTACVIRYLDIGTLADDFLENLPERGKNVFSIHNVKMTKDLCPRAMEPRVLTKPVVTVDAGGFKEVVPGKQVICGTINQEDPKFGQGPNILSAPIAIMALTMTLLHKPTTWAKPLIDEIIELGYDLYEETLDFLQNDFDVWTDRIDIYKVKSDYKVGFMKANFETRLTTQMGVIDSKNEHVLNLRRGIGEFFEENTHGVLITEPLTLAIWEGESIEFGFKDEKPSPMIYIFDPNPRSPTGMPLFTGTACLVGFVNADLAADHIISCIMPPDLRMGEFTIVPVEIVVGNLATKRKIARTAPKSEANCLPRCSKSAVIEERRILRRIGEREWKMKEHKRRELIGRKGYYPMKGGFSIIRGHRSQNSKTYCEYSRNNQDIPNCVTAIVMNHISSVENWNCRHIDLILDTGDQLYIDSYIAYGPKDEKLGLENVLRAFYMNSMLIHVTVYKPIVSDLFTNADLCRVLNVYFQQEIYCLLSYERQWVSIFFKSGYFYLFDPHERNIEGKVAGEKETGMAMVLKVDDIEKMTDRLIENLSVEEQEGGAKKFSLWLISVEIKHD